MATEPARDLVNDLASGYERMLARIRERLTEAEVNAPLPIYMAIEEAREQAVTLGEMTQAEAGQVAYWLKRDLLHLRDVISRAERGVKTWLGIDLGLIEQGLLDTLADPARVDWLRLQEEFEAAKQESATTQDKRHAQTGKTQDP
jgi:hypothetical protein